MCLTSMYALASAVAAGTLNTETGFLSLVDQFGVAPYLMFLLAPGHLRGPARAQPAAGHPRRTRRVSRVHCDLRVAGSSQPRLPALYPASRLGTARRTRRRSLSELACRGLRDLLLCGRRGDRLHAVARGGAGAVSPRSPPSPRGPAPSGAFVTLERGVWIAALAASLVTALVTRAGRRWIVPGLLVCALVIGGALAISPGARPQNLGPGQPQISVWDRQNQTYAGLRMLAAKPLFGFGWERYTKRQPRILPADTGLSDEWIQARRFRAG